MHRFFYLPIVVALLLGTLAACTDSSAPGAAKPLVYGGQYYPEEFLLQQDPFWNDSSGSYKLFSSGTESNEALVAGRVDANVASDTKSVALFNAIPKEAIIIACVQGGERYATIVANSSEARDWNDLKGKKVATRFGTGAEVVLRRYFAENGLAWNDFQQVNLPVEEMVTALDAGHIDAFTAWSVTPELAEASGRGKRLSVSYAPFSAPACIHTTRTTIQQKRPQLLELLVAHLKKAHAIKTDPAGSARRAASGAQARGVSIPEAAFLTAFQRIDFEVKLDDASLSNIKSTAEFMASQKLIDHAPTIAADPTLLEQARRQLRQ